MEILTKGDNYNIKCPLCGKNNHYVCYGDDIPSEEKPTEFWKPCWNCKYSIYYKAERGEKDKQGFPTIKIIAYSEYPDICLHI